MTSLGFGGRFHEPKVEKRSLRKQSVIINELRWLPHTWPPAALHLRLVVKQWRVAFTHGDFSLDVAVPQAQ